MKVLQQPNKENREKTKTEIQELISKNRFHESRVDYIRLILLLY